jgi:hypothetical protein
MTHLTESEPDEATPKPVSPIAAASMSSTQFPISSTTINEPPPPYRDRRTRHGTRTARAAGQSSESHPVDDLDDEEAENTPLLAHSTQSNRQRTVSHSSNAISTHSLAHNVFSLFQAENSTPQLETETPRRGPSTWSRISRYFRPLHHREYYSALFHLLAINFPIALFAWIYLFVATFVRAFPSLL